MQRRPTAPLAIWRQFGKLCLLHTTRPFASECPQAVSIKIRKTNPRKSKSSTTISDLESDVYRDHRPSIPKKHVFFFGLKTRQNRDFSAHSRVFATCRTIQSASGRPSFLKLPTKPGFCKYHTRPHLSLTPHDVYSSFPDANFRRLPECG